MLHSIDFTTSASLASLCCGGSSEKIHLPRIPDAEHRYNSELLSSLDRDHRKKREIISSKCFLISTIFLLDHDLQWGRKVKCLLCNVKLLSKDCCSLVRAVHCTTLEDTVIHKGHLAPEPQSHCCAPKIA